MKQGKYKVTPFIVFMNKIYTTIQVKYTNIRVRKEKIKQENQNFSCLGNKRKYSTHVSRKKTFDTDGTTEWKPEGFTQMLKENGLYTLASHPCAIPLLCVSNAIYTLYNIYLNF